MILAVERERHRVIAEQTLPCRELALIEDRWLVVNQGLHGLAIYDTVDDRLDAVAQHKPAVAIETLTPSVDGKFLLTINTHSGVTNLYQVDYPV